MRDKQKERCKHPLAVRSGRYLYCPECECSWYFPKHMNDLFSEVDIRHFKEKKETQNAAKT